MSKQIREYERQYLLQNMNNASYNREKKELYKRKEIENDKKALETLQQKIEEEKKLAYEKKRQIQSAQLKEYEDYINRKYHISRNENESIDKSLQIKIGSENRYIKNTQDFRNKDYYDKSEVIDFSDKGKINQRGQSHGYNIINHQPFQIHEKEYFIPQYNTNFQSKINSNNNNDIPLYNNPNNNNISKNNIPSYNEPNNINNNNNISKNNNDDILLYNNPKVNNNLYNNIPLYDNSNINNIPLNNNKEINNINIPLSNPNQKSIKDDYTNNSNLNNININNNIPQYQNPIINSYDNNNINKEIPQTRFEKIEELTPKNNNITESENQNFDFQKNEKIKEEDYQKYNDYLDILKKQNEENNSLYQKALESIQKDKDYLNQNPISSLPNNNNNNYNEINNNNNYEEKFYYDKNYNDFYENIQNKKTEDNINNLNEEMKRLNIESKNEYLINKKKNLSSFGNLRYDNQIYEKDNFINYNPFTISTFNEIPKQNKLKNNLDSQLNAKQLYIDTYYNLENGQVEKIKRDNPYLELRERKNKINEINVNPYNQRSYNFGDSYLNYNPILNPGNYIHDRNISSGRLQSLGNNIIKK